MMAYSINAKDYFNTKLYTGSGSAQSLTGVGFQPDLIWIKNRSYADHHKAVDRVRWVSSSNSAQLSPNQTAVAGTQGIITSFDADGYTLSTGDRGWNSSNGDNFVSWNWKANGAGSSNTDGSITSTVSASTTSGFSIMTWTGTGSNGTIGHGLGKAPKMLIIKNTNNTQAWMAYHASTGNNTEIQFNATGATAGSSTAWQDTDPDTSKFYVGGSAGDSVNANGYTYVGYAFADIQGYSKFGSYKGNGNNDGSFTYLGFAPSFIITRRTDSSNSWYMYSRKTSTTGGNLTDKYLEVNANGAEATTTGEYGFDFLSNGFKARGTGGGTNANNGNYIYMAFAEAPLVGSNNVPATAR